MSKYFSYIININWLIVGILVGVMQFDLDLESSIIYAFFYLLVFLTLIYLGIKSNQKAFSKILEKSNSIYTLKNLVVTSIIFLLLNLIVLIYIGIPALQEDVNLSKTVVSDYPYLARIFRFGSPVIISLIGFNVIKSNNDSIKVKLERLLYINCIFLMILGILYGFKSYMLYPFLPTLAYTLVFKKNIKHVFFLIVGLLISMLVATANAENSNLYSSIVFLTDRITEVQFLGNVVAENNSHVYELNPQPYADVKQIYSKISSDFDYKNAQKELFNIYHNREDLRMELAITSLTEYKLSGGYVLVFLFSLMAIFYLQTIKLICTKSKDFVFCVCVLNIGFTSYFDALLNGQFLYRSLDALVGIIFIFIVFKSILFVSKQFK